MPRITDQVVTDAIEKMANETGLPLEPYWAYGKVKILILGQETRSGRGRTEFSPTFDSNSDLMMWIDAFMQGWQMRGKP